MRKLIVCNIMSLDGYYDGNCVHDEEENCYEKAMGEGVDNLRWGL